jgi:hypothetical protein
MILPHYVYLTPKGKVVKRDDSTFNDQECQLTITGTKEGILIDYYCENETFLNEEQIKFIIKNADKL